MRLAFILIAFGVLLSVNYFTGWSYDQASEDLSGKHDSVKMMISHRYAKLTPIKWVVLGENYRKEWATPVKMPIFHVNIHKGGFRILRLGGGEQTKSLHLLDSAGGKWVLRMVDKDVKPAMPANLRNGFATDIVQDQISAAYPYAPLTIGALSDAVGVPAEIPELLLVPDDSLLGQYRTIFRNQVCFLEKEMPPSNTPFRINTEDVRKGLEAKDSFGILQERVLTARLLDMLIADWDRHDRQWDWTWMDSAGVRYFYPIPEDRDQAYFYSTGLLTNIVRVIGMPQLIGFRAHSDGLCCLNHKTQAFDRYFLNQLSADDWRRVTTIFVQKMTDDVIHKALKKLPPEIYGISGRKLELKLKSRRDGLVKNVMEYYAFLASDSCKSSNTSQKAEIRQ